MTRRVLLLLAVVASLAAAIAPATAPPAAAASPGLTITSDTRYAVDPAHSRVRVRATLTIANHRHDTKTREFYYDRAYLAVQPGTSGFRISSATGDPSVSVASKKKSHTLLRIDFGKRLNAGATRTMTLAFNIVDKGGAPTRDIRIGTSLVSFGAWAFATDSTPGGTVAVTWPAGYNVEVDSPELGKPQKDASGRLVYSTGRLATPLKFFAYFVADRPTDYAETALSVDVQGRTVPVVVRAWPDDPAWGKRVGKLLTGGLPALGNAIGLPWLASRPLIVAEAISRSSAGYSGRYDPETGRIEVAYYADSLIALHEAAHAWFDGRLLADRWANEGFASWYANQAAVALGMKARQPVLSDALRQERIALNAWGPVGASRGPQEDYAYAASAELARLIAERAGTRGLASIWSAARERVGAYQPAGLETDVGGMAGGRGPGTDVAAVERGTAPPDWRGLLDLLEDRTGQSYEDLWRSWVIRPTDVDLLDARAEARRQYGSLVRRAGEWQLPRIIRDAMRAWQFDQATELMTAAEGLLDDRDEVTDAAIMAGLQMPISLKAAFERGHGFAAARSEADAELRTIAAYSTAAASRPERPDIVQQVGLWGTTPEAELADAALAFSRSDLASSVQSSLNAQIAWNGARDLGRNRIMTMLGATLAALIALAFIVARVRSWRRGVADRVAARRYAKSARAFRPDVAARRASADSSGASVSRSSARSMAHPMAHPIDADQPRPDSR